MASARVPPVLDVEEPTEDSSADGHSRGPGADSKKLVANPLWGAPRSHGELLKLGLTVSQSTVAKYVVRCQKPPSGAICIRTAKGWPFRCELAALKVADESDSYGDLYTSCNSSTMAKADR